MIPYGKHFIDEDDIRAVTDVLREGWLTQGPKVAEFEGAIAKYVGAKYAVAVNSGTSALHLCALAAGVGEGNSIITSPITFVASANAALYAGGKVLFADINSSSINIDTGNLMSAANEAENVKAIVPVHFAGMPCDMPVIKDIADKVDAHVIEDAAHALGAKYPDGQMVGCCSHSLMTIFSFHPVKAIAAGEGGVITTNDENIFHRLLRLRSHGINKDTDPLHYPQQDENGLPAQWYYEMQELGYNFRITDIQCALAISQLNKLNRFIERRKELVEAYDFAFKDSQICKPIQLTGRNTSAHHLYVLRIDFDALGKSRQQLIKELREKNIGTQVHYIPVPMQPVYKQMGFSLDDYPDAKEYYQQALSIPLYYSLTDDEQSYVIDSLKQLLE